jgi:hypothetical protein
MRNIKKISTNQKIPSDVDRLKFLKELLLSPSPKGGPHRG